MLEVERAYDWSDQPAQLGKDKACECAESRKTSEMQVYLSRLEGTADNRDVEGSIPSTCTKYAGIV